MKPSHDIENRFWSKVDQAGPCWLWTASKDPRGYGAFGIGSRSDGSRTTVAAHRFSYWLEHGFWSTRELFLHHRCENPSCVRPSHLEIVSPREHLYRHDSPPAKNGRLTHCRKCGRELAGDNLMIDTSINARRCRYCRNEYTRELKKAKRRVLQTARQR